MDSYEKQLAQQYKDSLYADYNDVIDDIYQEQLKEEEDYFKTHKIELYPIIKNTQIYIIDYILFGIIIGCIFAYIFL